MRNLYVLLLASFIISCTKSDSDILSNVNVFIGTGGYGHTHPAATVPFGMIQLGPDTRLDGWDGCSGYHYSDSIIYGFSHTHLSGTGVGDYNDLLIMPSSSVFNLDKEVLASSFDKQNEKASPGYYQVMLNDENIQADMTASPRGGIHRYSSLDDKEIWLALDLEHRDEVLVADLQQIDEYTLQGKRISKAWAEEQHFYFYIKSSAKIGLIRKLNGGRRMGIEFKEKPSSLELKVAISAVDEKGAERNFKEELEGKSFDDIRMAAEEKWRNQLGRVEISADNEVMTNFYTSMYHASIVPNLYTDVDGRYRGTDLGIHKAENHTQYTIFSLWDTYRTAHPLYTLINQNENNDFIKSMLAHYETGGKLPVWELAANYTGCMIGYHTVSVIADAYMKGQDDFDSDLALEAMVHISDLDELGKKQFAENGFIPAEQEHESVSKTLEYAYNDWCIAQMAKAKGKDDIYERYIQRAQNYKNLFNPDNGFMVPRVENRWLPTFDPYEVNFHFTEANAWQYHLYVPHDVEGLIQLFGGKEGLEKRLDELFSADKETSGREQADITGLIGQYAHGNEPSHHMAYLYNYVDQPAKAQEVLRTIMTELYHNEPDGLSGNEDCGQMSAWYIMSALGFYPVAPASNAYDLGSPMIDKAKIQLGNSKTLDITVHNNSPEKLYVEKVVWNGIEQNRSFIKHEEIREGGHLEFYMSSKPAEEKTLESFSASVSDFQIVPVPAFSSGKRAFAKADTVALNVASDARIFFRIQGENSEFKEYEGPFEIQSSTVVEAYAQSESGQKSKSIKAEFRKIESDRTISLVGDYANQYAAGGDNALIDFLYGGKDFRTGEWQGYEGQNMIATIDLGKVQELKSISLGALQDENSWIFLPVSVDFEFSMDGEKYQKLGSAYPSASPEDEGTILENFTWEGNCTARYIKVKANNMIDCPSGHKSAGNVCWIFLDEITLK